METAASTLIWISLLIIIGGWYSWIRSRIAKKTASIIPLLGSVFLIFGVYLHPNKDFWNILKPWVFIVLIIDLGAIPLVIKNLTTPKKI